MKTTRAKRILGKEISAFTEDSFADNERQILAPMPDLDVFIQKRGKLAAKFKDIPHDIRPLYTEPLLSREQERHLFRMYNFHKWKFMQLRQQELTRTVKDKCDKHLKCAALVRKQIVACNLRLVVAIVKKNRFYQVRPTMERMNEMVSDGNLGLFSAVDYFDFRKGLKFSTYATYAVRDRLNKAVTKKCERDSRFQFEGEEVMETVPLPQVSPPIGRIIRKALRRLKGKEKIFVERYYAIKRGTQQQDLQELSNEFGISKERVRQIRNRGLEMIRKRIQKGLDDFSN